MFLKKIKRLGDEWGVAFCDLEGVARESLRYGMRLTRTPGQLKRELKAVGIDSTLATPMWSGNAYLLIQVPRALFTRKKAAAIDPEDMRFIRRVLTPEDRKILRERFRNLPDFTSCEILGHTVSYVRNQSRRGRFLPFFDSMYESTDDVEHDLIEETLKIINKEMTNFRTHEPEDIKKYIQNCMGKKAKTYFRSRSPKMFKSRIETPEDFDRIVETHRAEEFTPNDYESHEVAHDLSKLLPRAHYRAISLLMGFASEAEQQQFDEFLQRTGQNPLELTPKKLKVQIERHLGCEVFDALRQHPDLVKYLKT